MLTIGLLINPAAGVGGPAAMKGSDGSEAQARARELGVAPQAITRARTTFAELAGLYASKPQSLCRIITLSGSMGEDALTDLPLGSFSIDILSEPQIPEVSTASTTRAGVEALAPLVDLLVFVGGDGTARDVLDALVASGVDKGDPPVSTVPVLGIPAGVKMHSGVFATSPGSAAQLLALLIEGGLVAAHRAEVKDIDEAALRRGSVGSLSYGELLVPSVGGYLQHTKSAGKEVESLVLLEIAAEVAESFASETPLVLGPGSTCFAVKEELLDATPGSASEQPTLLGVDVIQRGRLLQKDASATELLAVQQQHPTLNVIVSFSRAQGFLIGRGNQQLSPEFLEQLPESSLHIVSSRTKLSSLAGRPLLVDSGQAALDQKFSGLRTLISGYQDHLLYLVQRA